MCADSNPDMSHVPVSLAPLSWWRELGVAGCNVLMTDNDLAEVKVVKKCQVVLPLVELSARSLHSLLKSELHIGTLCCMLHSARVYR